MLSTHFALYRNTVYISNILQFLIEQPKDQVKNKAQCVLSFRMRIYVHMHSPIVHSYILADAYIHVSTLYIQWYV